MDLASHRDRGNMENHALALKDSTWKWYSSLSVTFHWPKYVTWSYEPQRSRKVPLLPHVPGRRSPGQCLVTSTDHYPKFSQLTLRADGHASSESSNLIWIRSPAPSPHFPRCFDVSIHLVHTQPPFSILPFLCLSYSTHTQKLPSKVHC